jgi:class 3 adenylate cyclase
MGSEGQARSSADGMVSTFLFVDLVGFTALAAERGDEHAADAALALYRCVRPLLPDHGAEEVKTIGDAMMLRCGHAGSAVRLGVRIVGCVEDHGGLPAIRVGVHTGPAAYRDGDFYGAAVNVAARLCSAAGSGQVLVSDATRSAAGRLAEVDFGEQRLHWLKNVTAPVAARVAAECDPVAAASGLSTVLRTRLAASRSRLASVKTRIHTAAGGLARSMSEAAAHPRARMCHQRASTISGHGRLA